jgi:hypothetical protein
VALRWHTPAPTCGALKPTPWPQGLIAEEQVGPGLAAFDTASGLQPIAQAILPEGEHFPWDDGL